MVSYGAMATIAAIILITAIGESVAPASNIAIRVYVITIVTSVLAEVAGAAPRVLWIVPLWLVGLTFLGVHIYEEHGVLGIVAAVLAAIALLALTIVVGRFHERRQERRDLAAKIRTTDLRGLNPIYDQAWDAVHEAILLPREISWTPEMCAHNYEVAQIAVPWLLQRNPTARRADQLRQVVNVLAAGTADFSRVDPDALAQVSEFLQVMVRKRDDLDLDPVVTDPRAARLAIARARAAARDSN